MNFNEYRILAYAKSEMDPVGTDFVVVLGFKEAEGVRVQSVLSATWKNMFHSADTVDLEYLQDFIYDLRQQSHPNRECNPNFFESISDLNIGPLRTSSSGEVDMLDLSSIHRDFDCHHSDICTCSEEAFTALGQRLRQMNQKFTAATNAG